MQANNDRLRCVWLEREWACSLRAMTTRLDTAITSAKTQVPDCVAVGLVDLDSALLLAYKTTDQHPESILSMVAAAAQEMFEGANVKTIESLFAERRGVAGESLINEVWFGTKGTQHFMVRGGRGGRQVVVFVCAKAANIGMILAKGRPAAETIFAAM